MDEANFANAPDGGALRTLPGGLVIVRRKKHEWIESVHKMRHEKLRVFTDKVFGRKFVRAWGLSQAMKCPTNPRKSQSCKIAPLSLCNWMRYLAGLRNWLGAINISSEWFIKAVGISRFTSWAARSRSSWTPNPTRWGTKYQIASSRSPTWPRSRFDLPGVHKFRSVLAEKSR